MSNSTLAVSIEGVASAKTFYRIVVGRGKDKGFLLLSQSRMAIPSAAPSSGSVPAPSSSRSTRESGPTLSSIPATAMLCHER